MSSYSTRRRRQAVQDEWFSPHRHTCGGVSPGGIAKQPSPRSWSAQTPDGALRPRSVVQTAYAARWEVVVGGMQVHRTTSDFGLPQVARQKAMAPVTEWADPIRSSRLVSHTPVIMGYDAGPGG